MPIYKDINNDSGVHSYETGFDYIVVRFKRTSQTYTYSYASAGQHHVEEMKRLADLGNGLNSYINYNVKYKYER